VKGKKGRNEDGNKQQATSNRQASHEEKGWKRRKDEDAMLSWRSFAVFQYSRMENRNFNRVDDDMFRRTMWSCLAVNIVLLYL
jgi:hypothetical protein